MTEVELELEIDDILEPVEVTFNMEYIDEGYGDYEWNGQRGTNVNMVWRMANYTYLKSSYSDDELEAIDNYVYENIYDIEQRASEELNNFY